MLILSLWTQEDVLVCCCLLCLFEYQKLHLICESSRRFGWNCDCMKGEELFTLDGLFTGRLHINNVFSFKIPEVSEEVWTLKIQEI